MISAKKLLISVLLGLGGFWFSLYSLKFSNPPFSITITWSYFLPLLAAMAYGPVYGIIAGILGLGAFYPFLLYPNNGWANFINAAAVALWFAWYGYFEQLRRKKASFWNHPFFIHLPYALFYILFMRLLYPVVFSLNPPFWNPGAERSMPISILDGVIAKGIIMMYLTAIVDGSILMINPVRKILGLEGKRSARENGKIILSAILCSFLFWCVLLIFNRIFVDKVSLERLFLIQYPFEILALIVFISAGFFIGAIICQYVELRLKSEDALEESRENYRLIFEQAADVIFIADAQGNYLDVNESGCKLTGYTRDEILHLNMRDLVMAEEQNDVPLRINEVNTGENIVFERRMCSKNGSPIPVEINAQRLADGRLQGLIRDISRRKQVEEVLRTSNEQLTQFIRNSPIFAFLKEVNSTQSLVLQASENYQEMIGIPGSQMIGKNMYELFPSDLAAKMTADDWTVVSNGKVLKLEENLNGRHYLTIKFPIRYGAKSFLAGYTIDITDQRNVELSRRALLSLLEDQKEAEEQIRRLNTELEERVIERTAQLAAANKELEAFAYSVSHDLRAPLRALDGFSAALLEDCADQLDEQGQLYLSRIQEASRRMEQLISNLLKLSQVTRAELRSQQVDLSGLVHSITTELTAQNPERIVAVEIAANMLVKGDANLLKIALENLLNNAYKFTGKCARAIIQVGVTEDAGERVYFVRDNGTGFNMDYAGKLFTPFQRLHSDQEFPGTGIGLSIVQRIITRHGGRIWPESEVGQGTTFYFTLKSSQD